jgi:hypothetical protein
MRNIRHVLHQWPTNRPEVNLIKGLKTPWRNLTFWGLEKHAYNDFAKKKLATSSSGPKNTCLPPALHTEGFANRIHSFSEKWDRNCPRREEVFSESGNKMFNTCHANAKISTKIGVEIGNTAHHFIVLKFFKDVSQGDWARNFPCLS